MFTNGVPSNPDVTTAEWSPLTARYTAPYTFDTADSGRVVLLAAYARVDAGWASGGSATTYPTGLPPQAHVVRARTDPHYHAENAGHVIAGHVWWYSSPRCYLVDAPGGGVDTTTVGVSTTTSPDVNTTTESTVTWGSDDVDENDATDDRAHGDVRTTAPTAAPTAAPVMATFTTAAPRRTTAAAARTTTQPIVNVVDTAENTGSSIRGNVSAVAIGAFAVVVIILVGGTMYLLHRARRGRYSLVTNAESFNPLWSVDDVEDSWDNGSGDEEVVVERRGGAHGGPSAMSYAGASATAAPATTVGEESSLEEYYRWSMKADDVAGMAAAIGEMSPTDSGGV